MSRVIYEELQDKEGNVHYLHTEDKVVFDENGQSLRSAMKEVQFEDYTGAAELPSIETALTGIVRGRKWTDLFGNVKAALKGLATKSEALEGSMGDAFSEGRAYAAGDYAIYKNVLYKFTAAKTAGAWDAAKVRAVTVAEEMCSLNGNLGGFHFYHSLTELGINSPSTMTYQDFVNHMPENSILMCYIQGNNFSPNSTDGCALFVNCTGSTGSKKIIFETTSMSGASSDFYMARYSAAAGTQWTGWIRLATSTQLDTKLAKSDVANNLTTTASGKALDARQGKILNDKINNKTSIFIRKGGSSFSVNWTNENDVMYLDFYIDSTRVARVKANSVLG